MRISDWSSDVCSSDLIAAAHLVEHRRSDEHARHTDRMTERNAGAIDVQNVEPAVAFAPAPLLEDGENLGRGGLVEFDQSDVAPVAPRPGEQIGRAHVCTPANHAHLVCRLLLEQKKNST